jgi:hypothetical protein
VIRGTAIRKRLFHLVDVMKETTLIALLKLVRLTLLIAKNEATTFSDLTMMKQSYYKILFNEHKDNVREFKQ